MLVVRLHRPVWACPECFKLIPGSSSSTVCDCGWYPFRDQCLSDFEDAEDIAAAREAIKDDKFTPWEQVKEELDI